MEPNHPFRSDIELLNNKIVTIVTQVGEYAWCEG